MNCSGLIGLKSQRKKLISVPNLSQEQGRASRRDSGSLRQSIRLAAKVRWRPSGWETVPIFPKKGVAPRGATPSVLCFLELVAGVRFELTTFGL